MTVTGKDYFAEPRCERLEDTQFTFTCSHEKAITDGVELNKTVKKVSTSANEWGYIALPDQNKSSLNLIEVWLPRALLSHIYDFI